MHLLALVFGGWIPVRIPRRINIMEIGKISHYAIPVFSPSANYLFSAGINFYPFKSGHSI